MKVKEYYFKRFHIRVSFFCEDISVLFIILISLSPFNLQKNMKKGYEKYHVLLRTMINQLFISFSIV